jgi:hypothetical protein
MNMTGMSSVQNNGRSTGGCTGKGFMPGRSGNPGGRPKSARDFSEMIRDYLGEHGPARKTKLRGLIERLYKEDPKTLLAYAFGKPIEMHEVTAQNEHIVDPETLAVARALAKELYLAEPAAYGPATCAKTTETQLTR